MSKCRITDAGIEHLRNLKNLRSLNIFGTQISDASLKVLRGMTELRDIYLTDLKLSAEAVTALKKALPNLKVAGP